MKRIILSVFLVCFSLSCYAVSITVAPTTGVEGTATAKTIANAITQINAGADAANAIVLRSTEGAHVLPANTTWTFNAGKSVTFSAESGQPVVRLTQSGTTRYMLIIAAGTAANNQTETITFNGIAFVPMTALGYATNQGDGIQCSAGKFVFQGCVFSNNNGSDGVASQEGSIAFVQPSAGNNVGDDWIQVDTPNDCTFSNCTVTGCNDDAIIFGGATAPNVATLKLDQGTVIANVGGAGIQMYVHQAALLIDGSAGRVLIAKTGQRTGAPDAGIKFFADVGCSANITKCDIIEGTQAGFYDLDGVSDITITDSRIANCNSGSAASAGLFAVADSYSDSGSTNQIIRFTRCTFHDCLAATPADAFFAAEGSINPRQTYTIQDCIFSGAGDTYANMTNGTSGGGASPAPVVTFSAAVTNGTHALNNVGDLGAGLLAADPQYVSTTYTIGRNQANPDFLLPAAAAYATANSAGQRLKGGAPGNVAGILDWALY